MPQRTVRVQGRNFVFARISIRPTTPDHVPFVDSEQAVDIRVGEVGKIVSGQELGRFIKVIDNATSTDGFLILTASAPDMHDGFDSWVESREMLQRFFEEAGWIVEWPQ